MLVLLGECGIAATFGCLLECYLRGCCCFFLLVKQKWRWRLRFLSGRSLCCPQGGHLGGGREGRKGREGRREGGEEERKRIK